ncbi:CsbD family protein [Pseudokineococcus sp. 1T1Z-3]|uniref:CsbD family protein n=1 Tax=Pseudokineococcus sp. 1T1Z-3 TaxID=3132745 RepID=UPI0030A30DF1
MSATDKIKNAAQQASGKAKEVVGSAQGDDEKRADGKADQTSGDLKQRGEHLKDAVKD